jgi:hypothetical protein
MKCAVIGVEWVTMGTMEVQFSSNIYVESAGLQEVKVD